MVKVPIVKKRTKPFKYVLSLILLILTNTFVGATSLIVIRV